MHGIPIYIKYCRNPTVGTYSVRIGNIYDGTLATNASNYSQIKSNTNSNTVLIYTHPLILHTQEHCSAGETKLGTITSTDRDKS